MTNEIQTEILSLENKVCNAKDEGREQLIVTISPKLGGPSWTTEEVNDMINDLGYKIISHSIHKDMSGLSIYSFVFELNYN